MKLFVNRAYFQNSLGHTVGYGDSSQTAVASASKSPECYNAYMTRMVREEGKKGRIRKKILEEYCATYKKNF